MKEINIALIGTGLIAHEHDDVHAVDVCLQTMLISEGLYLSGTLNREILTDEISSLGKSNAISRQYTSFGELIYPPYPFF